MDDNIKGEKNWNEKKKKTLKKIRIGSEVLVVKSKLKKKFSTQYKRKKERRKGLNKSETVRKTQIKISNYKNKTRSPTKKEQKKVQ